jgi:hypothetical protein
MTRNMNGAKEKHWRGIVDRQAGSGLSVRRFCASEGISEPSFYAWRKKLRWPKGNDTRTPRTTRHREETPDSTRLFVPLQLLDTATTMEIVHPLGYRIQLTGDVNPVALRRVIEALDERSAQ